MGTEGKLISLADIHAKFVKGETGRAGNTVVPREKGDGTEGQSLKTDGTRDQVVVGQKNQPGKKT